MKKIYTLLAGFIMFGSITSKGQDTLLYESFNFQNFYDNYLIVDVVPPAGVNVDTLWYSWDGDGLPDGTPAGTREGGWFPVQPFANVDTTENVALAASSWFPSPGGTANNWLITPNVQLGDHDTLFWKSAPFQTPRYCDGYQVLISTTTNSDLAFTDTLFTAAEMTAILGTNDSVFSGYSFSSGFVHGLDGTFTEFDADSARLRGVLKPFSVALDAYANQNIFIAIHHNSFDDNLISIDDMLIRGTTNPVAGIKENKADLFLNVFPNPAKDNIQVNYVLSAETDVTIRINDVTGKLVYSESKSSLNQGRHFTMVNTSALAKGFYTVAVQTNNGKSTTKLIVQ